MLDDAPDGLGYLVPADADRGDRVVVIKPEGLQEVIRLSDVIHLFDYVIKISFLSSSGESIKSPSK